MLGMNVVLTNLLENQHPEEYNRRKEERKAILEASLPIRNRVLVLPVILVGRSDHARFTPGSVLNFSIPDEMKLMTTEAVRFARDSGSNRVCILTGLDADIQSLGIIALVQNLSRDGIKVTTEARCELMQPPEMHQTGTHYMAKVSSASDDKLADPSRVVDTLMLIKTELDQRLIHLGEAGVSQLLTSISSTNPGLVGSVERTFVSLSDFTELRRILSNYTALEKLSFFLFNLVHFEDDTRHLLIDARNTHTRLEAILRRLRSRESVISAHANPRTMRSLLRLNSAVSASFFLCLLVLVLYIKGSGYFELTNQYKNRYR